MNHGTRVRHSEGLTGSPAVTDRPRNHQLPAWDSTLAFLGDPYRFIGSACRAQGASAVRGRLALRPTVFLTGAEAARSFYGSPHLFRQGAAPEPVLATLLGHGGVQTLDGRAHRLRKAMFMRLVTGPPLERLVAIADVQWGAVVSARSGWAARGDTVSLYPVMQQWLFATAVEWAGIRMQDTERPRFRARLVALFDGAASSVRGHLYARAARSWLQAWLAERVVLMRHGEAAFKPGSPAHVVAMHCNPDGGAMHPRVAAVELLNLLRPIVAVSVFVVFCAHALAVHFDQLEGLEDVAA